MRMLVSRALAKALVSRQAYAINSNVYLFLSLSPCLIPYSVLKLIKNNAKLTQEYKYFIIIRYLWIKNPFFMIR